MCTSSEVVCCYGPCLVGSTGQVHDIVDSLIVASRSCISMYRRHCLPDLDHLLWIIKRCFITHVVFMHWSMQNGH